MSGTEHPWHLPSATTKHYQWFRNLTDFHALTLSWIKELQIDRAPYLMPRGMKTISSDVSDNLWMLEALAETDIETLLDDTHPEDVLGRLQHTIWAAQSWTLAHLLESAPEAERGPLITTLEQTSWKAGRRLGEERWPDLSAFDRADLRVLLSTFADTPFWMETDSPAFLLRRGIADRLEIELRHCPHQSHYTEVKSVADPLCRTHTQWMRGFLYALNNRVSADTEHGQPRCVQHWSFLETSPQPPQ